jgi:hypothetical protein
MPIGDSTDTLIFYIAATNVKHKEPRAFAGISVLQGSGLSVFQRLFAIEFREQDLPSTAPSHSQTVAGPVE